MPAYLLVMTFWRSTGHLDFLAVHQSAGPTSMTSATSGLLLGGAGQRMIPLLGVLLASTILMITGLQGLSFIMGSPLSFFVFSMVKCLALIYLSANPRV